MTPSAKRSSRAAAALLAMLAAGATLTGCVTETERVPSGERQQTEGGQPQGGSADGHAFVHTRDNGEPIRWSSCEPIRYVVREANEPEGARKLLEDSVRRISEATGLEFSYEGTTDEAPAAQRPLYQPDRYGDVWAPVLVAYSDADEYERLRGQTAGYGGAAYVQTGDRAPRYVSGMVVLDVDGAYDRGGDEAFRAVIMHELAHVIGLAHVDDRNQLMNPVQYGREVTTLQDGDLKGLEVLGAGECYEPIAPSAVRQ